MELVVEERYVCPHCGETIDTLVDTSLRECVTVEDCSVCCAPIRLVIRCAPGGVESLDATAD